MDLNELAAVGQKVRQYRWTSQDQGTVRGKNRGIGKI